MDDAIFAPYVESLVMVYRFCPDPERYGGFNRDEELRDELPPGREGRNTDEDRPAVEQGGYDREEELKNAELPQDREPCEGGDEND